MSIRSNGSYIGPRPAGPSSTVASGIWDLRTVERQIRASAWPLPPQPDPDFANVSLLLHMDGSNGSTTFTDSSSNAATVTAVGNASISTAQFKFGQSGLFDGSGDRLTVPSSSVFEFGTGDFTVEAWVRESTRLNYASVLEIGDHLQSTGVIFLTRQADSPNTAGIYSGGFFGSISSGSLNEWNHFAWVRQSGSLRVYVNGVSSSAVSFINNLTNTTNITVGSRSGGDNQYDFTGYMDELRVTKGLARYQDGTTFTPPALPFPDA